MAGIILIVKLLSLLTTSVVFPYWKLSFSNKAKTRIPQSKALPKPEERTVTYNRLKRIISHFSATSTIPWDLKYLGKQNFSVE